VPNDGSTGPPGNDRDIFPTFEPLNAEAPLDFRGTGLFYILKMYFLKM